MQKNGLSKSYFLLRQKQANNGRHGTCQKEKSLKVHHCRKLAAKHQKARTNTFLHSAHEINVMETPVLKKHLSGTQEYHTRTKHEGNWRWKFSENFGGEDFYLNTCCHDRLLVEDGVSACHVVVLTEATGPDPKPWLETARSTLLKTVNLNLG